MKYVIYKEAIDDYGEGDTIKFDKLEDAQSWWKEWFGNSFEYGSGYIVSHDGVLTARISVEPHGSMEKREVQTLVTAAVTAAQNEWDGLSDEQKALRGPRPTAISIP